VENIESREDPPPCPIACPVCETGIERAHI
jgi:hypothetical protein